MVAHVSCPYYGLYFSIIADITKKNNMMPMKTTKKLSEVLSSDFASRRGEVKCSFNPPSIQDTSS